MLRYLVFISLFSCSLLLSAQRNLVPNPGFEDDDLTPPSQRRNYVYKRLRPVVDGWRQATCGSVDYYNSDNSSVKGEPLHLAHSGQGRIGIILDKRRDSFIYYGQDTSGLDWEYKEYVQARLTEPLKKDKSYDVSFYIVLDKRSAFRAPNVGAYFSRDSILGNPLLDREDSVYGSHIPNNSNGHPLLYEPQVSTTDIDIMGATEHWVKVSGRFVARGGEKFITLGGFGHNHPVSLPTTAGFNYKMFYPSAYYYMDDVSVTEVAEEIPKTAGPPLNNFVLVLDVSESMRHDGKMDDLKKGVDSLLSSMGSDERISVITFGASPKVLAEYVPAAQKEDLIARIDSLKAGGGTNVPISIKRAYELMNKTYLPGGNNRVILITDAGYTISSHSKEIIENAFDEKNVHFSTMVFNDKHLRGLRHACNKTNGTCAFINSNYLAQQLKGEIEVKKPVVVAEKPDRDEYSGSLYDTPYQPITYNYPPVPSSSSNSSSGKGAKMVFSVILLALYAAVLAAKR